MRKLFFLSISLLFLASCNEHDLKTHKPCSFTIGLPEHMDLQPLPGLEHSAHSSYCNYEVLSKDGRGLFTVHSMPYAQFESTDLDELYDMAIRNSKFTLQSSLKNSQDLFFVIEGTNPENGHQIYWKRVIGKTCISDLYFNYPKSLSKEVEPYQAAIAASFTSD
jgi:hypothetical protein